MGYIAHQEGVAVGEVASGGSGLAFVAFPTALALLPAPNLFSVMFFVMLLSLGLGSVVALVEVRRRSSCSSHAVSRASNSFRGFVSTRSSVAFVL